MVHRSRIPILPRKFKVAVTGPQQDRAVIHAHDIGLQIVEQNDWACGSLSVVAWAARL